MKKTVRLETLDADSISPQFKDHYDITQKRISRLVLDSENKHVELFTIGLPFISNPDAPEGFDPGKPFVSSVCVGEYKMVQRQSPSKGLQWHFYNPDLGVYLEKSDCTDLDEEGQPIWQRYSTMFHIGNHVRNVLGCEAPGRRLHQFPDPDGLGVSSSAVALNLIKEHLKGANTHKLVIS